MSFLDRSVVEVKIPPSNDIALNFGKPDFDLIKPARIGRRVMDPNAWIGVKKLQDIGFMCAQVVDHDVNFSALRLAGHDLAQKVDKLGGGLADDVAGASVQRTIQ
jgi:hypothetical protein